MIVNAWARHYQEVWLERAGDPALPDWLRVASAAYGRHRANGHATFKRGQLALILASVDPETGAVVPLDRRHLYRAIQTAINHRWLSDRSTARCLIVPAHAVTGGLGDAQEECPQHVRHSGKRHHSGMTFTPKRHHSVMSEGATQ